MSAVSVSRMSPSKSNMRARIIRARDFFVAPGRRRTAQVAGASRCLRGGIKTTEISYGYRITFDGQPPGGLQAIRRKAGGDFRSRQGWVRSKKKGWLRWKAVPTPGNVAACELSRKRPKPSPWKELVPDLVTTFTAPEEVRLFERSKLDCATENSEMALAGISSVVVPTFSSETSTPST